MESSIHIESLFDGRSHHGSFRQHLWYRWKGLLILRAFLCLATIGMGLFFMVIYGHQEKAQLIASGLIVIGSFAFVRPMVWQMWSERKMKKHPAYGTTISYTFSEEGILMDGVSGRVDVPWAVFKEVVPLPKGLILYQSKKDYLWIPISDIDADQMSRVSGWFEVAQN